MRSVTNAERKHLELVAGIGCILCRNMGISETPAEIHHLRTGTGAGRKAGHFESIPLCPIHHRLGNDALHVMGRKAFERHHGVTELELLEQVRELLGICA